MLAEICAIRFIFDSWFDIRDLRLGRVQSAFALVLAFSSLLNEHVLRPRSLPLFREGNQVVSRIRAPWVNHSVLDGYPLPLVGVGINQRIPP